ncbi:MAG: hypothetical protein NT069_18090 [Planctomycetota bacterium]|nr:hypothetical protein [Planctomycetota bacterium]
MGLQENLGIATSAAMIVRQAVPFSSNAAETSSPIQTASGKVVNTVSHSKLTSKIRSGGAPEMPGDPVAWLESFEEIWKRCAKHKIGNCGELAAMCCLYLHKQRAFPVEYVQVDDGQTTNAVVPHVITVVGRAVNQFPSVWPKDCSPIGLPDTWGPDAVICDAWDHIAYPAADYDSFWGGLRAHSDAPGSLTCMLIHQL